MFVGHNATILIAIGELSIQTPEHAMLLVVLEYFMFHLCCGNDRELDNEVVWSIFHFGLVKSEHLCYYISRQAPPRRLSAYVCSPSPIPLPGALSPHLPPAFPHSFLCFVIEPPY
jgi:hypothetical protein